MHRRTQHLNRLIATVFLGAFCANAARADIKEAAAADDDITADLLTRITGENDKQLWFVEAHLDER